MDDANLAAIKLAAEHWRKGGAGASVVPPTYPGKLAKMTDYLRDARWKQYNEVPGEPAAPGGRPRACTAALPPPRCPGVVTWLLQFPDSPACRDPGPTLTALPMSLTHPPTTTCTTCRPLLWRFQGF